MAGGLVITRVWWHRYCSLSTSLQSYSARGVLPVGGSLDEKDFDVLYLHGLAGDDAPCAVFLSHGRTEHASSCAVARF